MFRKNLLKAKMVQLNLTVEDLADLMGCSIGSIYRKMRGESEFTRTEIQKLYSACNLTERELIKIFFHQ